MFKKCPRVKPARSNRPDQRQWLTKLDPAYWTRRLFRNTFTYQGRRIEVSGWSIKLQISGKRKTVTLTSTDRGRAAAEACQIYQTVLEQGWEAVAKRRNRIGFQRDAVSRSNNPPGLLGLDVEYWRRRLIYRRYPEPAGDRSEREFSVRIEHASSAQYFPLDTRDEAKAAEQAAQIYRTVTGEGWLAANTRFRRELTLAFRWLDNPIAWTYTTLHTRLCGEPSSQRPPTKSTEIAVAVLEPDLGLRLALTDHVNRQAGFRCVAPFAAFAEALCEIPRLQVDFLLLNHTLPDRPGTLCLDALRRLKPELVGLVYSVFEDSDHLFKATPGGADGYMLKRSPPSRLLEPIGNLTAPVTWKRILTSVRDYFQSLSASLPSGMPPPELARLTPREHEILVLLSRGDLGKEIADTLGISIWTVQGHMKSIFEKLNVHTRTEAVVKYLQK